MENTQSVVDEQSVMDSRRQLPAGQSSKNTSAGVGVGVGATGLERIPTLIPVHPDVRFKKLTFYDLLGTLIEPLSLVPSNTELVQEMRFNFTLTPQQATEIAMNRDIRNPSMVEHNIQVQLRFCLLETTSCEQEDCLPLIVNVQMNNEICQLPTVIPTHRLNVEPKRRPLPVNVTSNVMLSPTVINNLTVRWCPDNRPSTYCLAVYLVKKLTTAELLQRLMCKGLRPADYTRRLIKEKFAEDAECKIATTMLKVSLNCPLGKLKMSLPCRAVTCSHLQCFDANLYLQMNERMPTWHCPVCNMPAIYEHLVIDDYFHEVLLSPLLKSDDVEIQLNNDGSWSTSNSRSETQILDTPSTSEQKIEATLDNIELITEDIKNAKADAIPSSSTQEQRSSTSSNSETVDLTLSDSDDDLPSAKRQTLQVTSGAASATFRMSQVPQHSILVHNNQ